MKIRFVFPQFKLPVLSELIQSVKTQKRSSVWKRRPFSPSNSRFLSNVTSSRWLPGSALILLPPFGRPVRSDHCKSDGRLCRLYVLTSPLCVWHPPPGWSSSTDGESTQQALNATSTQGNLHCNRFFFPTSNCLQKSDFSCENQHERSSKSCCKFPWSVCAHVCVCACGAEGCRYVTLSAAECPPGASVL